MLMLALQAVLALTVDPELQGMRMQLPPRLLGQPTDALSSLAKAGDNIASSVGQAGSSLTVGGTRVAYMMSAGMIVSAGMITGPESLRPQLLYGLAVVFLTLELVLLPFVFPWLHKQSQGRGVSSATKIDKAREDYDSLRSFYDTTATSGQLVQHVLTRTKGKDLSDPAFDTVRAAIERCRIV